MTATFLLLYALSDRPNILLAISDDQSAPHASAYGTPGIFTPAFDRVAKRGVLFRHCYAASPGCAPSRAGLLTGRHPWSLRQAGTHASGFPAEFETYPERLAAVGYHTGHTGKGWGPGDYKVSGRSHNPAGPAYQSQKLKPPANGIRNCDYAANFVDFLDARSVSDQPWCFWYGASEPHRDFENGYGTRLGKTPDHATPPAFLPDTPVVRSDLLDYYAEIEWFDRHLGLMLDELDRRGELDNTLVIVTSDNGMSFPRAKANCYEFGISVPLAIAGPGFDANPTTSEAIVGFVDLTATILDAAGVDADGGHGTSLRGQTHREDRVAFSSRERHSSSRYQNWTYPQRSLRSGRWLLIVNDRPQRWPAGDPQKYDDNVLGPPHGGYHDIDACPTLTELIDRRREFPTLFRLAVDKRPKIELFDVDRDPACLTNLANDSRYEEDATQLLGRLNEVRRETGDPRVQGNGDIWESYTRYGKIRTFPPPPETLPE